MRRLSARDAGQARLARAERKSGNTAERAGLRPCHERSGWNGSGHTRLSAMREVSQSAPEQRADCASRYITQESHKLEVQVRPPMAVTNAVSWRSEGIRYRKNEVFLDVVESVNLLVNANGNVVRSEILGAVKMKCYLSGMPELRLGLNDKVMFESTGRGECAARRAASCSADAACSGTGQGDRDGGRQVPPMRTPLALRERPDHLVYPAGRRV